MNLLLTTQQTLARETLASFQDRILVAVSGGADSMALCVALKELGYDIGVAHCNFQLRGTDSDAEEAWVRQFTAAQNIPLFVKRFDTSTLLADTQDSLQMLARKLRYNFFEELLDAEKYTRCALAHHADDQAEWLLLHLIKSRNAFFLKGIPYKRLPFIRPLLDVPKSEILQFLKEREIPFMTDKSNFEDKYQRNFIRNQLLPNIHQLNPDFSTHLQEKYSFSQLQSHLLEKVLSDYYTCGNDLAFGPFEEKYGAESLPILIRFFLQKYKIHGYKVAAVLALQTKEVGKKVEIEHGDFIRTRKGISFVPTSESPNASFVIAADIEDKFEITVGAEGRLTIGHFPLEGAEIRFDNPHLVYLDWDSIRFPITMRKPHAGDVLQPLGLRGRKKIKDIFRDKKWTISQQLAAWVWEDALRIIAISGFYISDAVKITPETRYVLMMEWHPSLPS
jgi:tRNA(Ile)-lysidine synthase